MRLFSFAIGAVLSVGEFEQGEIGPDLFRATIWGFEGLVSKRADRPYRVLSGTRSDSWWLVERSGFVVRRDQAAIVFSFAIGMAFRKVCIGVLPKHQRL